MIASITFDDISPAFLNPLKLRGLVDFLNEANIACTLFVVPNYNKSFCLQESFASCLGTALEQGHELALHGWMHTKNEFGYFYPVPLPVPLPTLENQKQRIRKGVKTMINFTGIRPLGFRAPFYLHNNVTYEALSSLRFRYDSSATAFKPAHWVNLRIRWLRDCKPFKAKGVIEIPVTGDYTYNLKSFDFSNLLRRAIRDFEWIKSRQGVFVLNNHPQYLNDAGYAFLKILVKKLSSRTDFLRLDDVAQMYA